MTTSHEAMSESDALAHASSTQQWQVAVATLGPERAAAMRTGPFAVGMELRDGRTFLAVDRFATQTLCYRVIGSRLHHAERADQLADADTPVDPQAIFDYLYFHVIPSPRTVYAGVHRLLPGHYAIFDRGQLTVIPYWTPAFRADLDRRMPLFATNSARCSRKRFVDSSTTARPPASSAGHRQLHHCRS
jgi:asparagine synthetase B (glutamine-hydrolysing)